MGQEQRDARHHAVLDPLAKDRPERFQVGVGEAVRVRIARPEKLVRPFVGLRGRRLIGGMNRHRWQAQQARRRSPLEASSFGFV